MTNGTTRSSAGFVMVACLTLVVVPACDGALDPTPHPESVDWRGAYGVDGTWDLAGPFAEDRTLGGALSEIILGQAVVQLGVPSLAQEVAQEALSVVIGDKLATAIDDKLPSEVGPDSELVKALRATLASVQVTSNLTLADGLLPGSVTGTETVVGLSYVHEGITVQLAPGDLVPGSVNFKADWDGKEESSTRLEIDPHGFALHYGQLVLDVTLKVLDEVGVSSTQDAVMASLACDVLVAQALGDGGALAIAAGGVTYQVSATELTSGCDVARGAMGDKVLGLFALDSKVEVGGVVLVHDDDKDGIADRLTADRETPSSAGYGGPILVIPEPFAPRVLVSFTASR